MQRFGYRTPRYAAEFPVCLAIGGTTQVGRCRNISISGMHLETEKTLSPHSCGEVSFDYEGISVNVRVRVAHSLSGFTGLKFAYSSDEQRSAILRLISLLAAKRKPNNEISLVSKQKRISTS